jgi:hypothetical protein
MFPGSIPAATGVAGSADASAGSSAGGGDGEVTGGEGTETEEVTGIGPAGGLGRSSAKLLPEFGRQGSGEGGDTGAGSSISGDDGGVTGGEGTETEEVTGIGPAGGLGRSSAKLLPESGRHGSEEGGGVPGTCAETSVWSTHRLAARTRQQRIAHRPPQRLCISSPGCRPEGPRQLVRENLPVGLGATGG